MTDCESGTATKTTSLQQHSNEAKHGWSWKYPMSVWFIWERLSWLKETYTSWNLGILVLIAKIAVPCGCVAHDDSTRSFLWWAQSTALPCPKIVALMRNEYGRDDSQNYGNYCIHGFFMDLFPIYHSIYSIIFFPNLDAAHLCFLRRGVRLLFFGLKLYFLVLGKCLPPSEKQYFWRKQEARSSIISNSYYLPLFPHFSTCLPIVLPHFRPIFHSLAHLRFSKFRDLRQGQGQVESWGLLPGAPMTLPCFMACVWSIKTITYDNYGWFMTLLVQCKQSRNYDRLNDCHLMIEWTSTFNQLLQQHAFNQRDVHGNY